MPPLFLSDLCRNTVANVVAVHEADDVSLRLLEMGLVPGTQVTRVGSGPLGDPLEFALLRGKSASGCSKCSGSSSDASGSLLSPQPSKELHQITSNDDDV